MFITNHDKASNMPQAPTWTGVANIFLIVSLFFLKIKKSIILGRNNRSLAVLERRQDTINQNLIPNLEAGIYLSHTNAVSSSHNLVYCSDHFSWPCVAGKINEYLRQQYKATFFYQYAVIPAAAHLCARRVVTIHHKYLLNQDI